MFVVPILMGLACFLAALSLWTRAKIQPEDIPMFSLRGHRILSKKDVHVGAVLFLIMGIVFVITGLTL